MKKEIKVGLVLGCFIVLFFSGYCFGWLLKEDKQESLFTIQVFSGNNLSHIDTIVYEKHNVSIDYLANNHLIKDSVVNYNFDVWDKWLIKENARGKLMWSNEPPSNKFYFISSETYAVCYPRIIVENTGEKYAIEQIYNGEEWYLEQASYYEG